MVYKETILDKYGKNLNNKAYKGELDLVIGRVCEIERAVQVLSRRKKNNLMLIGSPGVGKSAIVEGLASRIVSHDVPIMLQNKILFELDVASIIAGTQFRGQLNERIKEIIDFLKENKEYILFIDEIHTIVKQGSNQDISNLLKPALSNSDVQMIGATTTDEYKKYVEKDPALVRRFQNIIVDPLSEEDTLKVLYATKESYEKHHGVIYSDTILKMIPRLAKRYIPDRELPDSAFDLLDFTGSVVSLKDTKFPEKIEKIENELVVLEKRKKELIINQQYELIRSLKNNIEKLTITLEVENKKWSDKPKKLKISEKDLIDSLGILSGIKIDDASDKNIHKLNRLENELNTKLIGQEKVKEIVIKTLKRKISGIANPKKPFSLFMLGSTATGKTQFAKIIADTWFEGNIIRIDCSELMEAHDISKLNGSAPGYVGYEDKNVFDRVAEKKFCLVLFDEFEKASTELHKLLLNILDEGVGTTSKGKKIDFSNTFIFITSNIGARKNSEFGKGIGFRPNSNSYQNTLDEEVKKFLPPELFNRFDEFVIFEKLEKNQIVQIVDLELNKLQMLLNDRNISMKVTKELKEFIADKGYSEEYGVRYLERSIKEHIIDSLTEYMLDNNVNDNSKLSLTLKNEKVIIKHK